MIGDSGKLQALALELDIEPDALELDVQRAVAEHAHRLTLDASTKDRATAEAEAKRIRDAQADEIERHQRALAETDAKKAKAAEQIEALERLCRERALKLATPTDDHDVLARRVGAGEIAFYVLMNLSATGPEYQTTVGNWLRECGWRDLPKGWSDPTKPEQPGCDECSQKSPVGSRLPQAVPRRTTSAECREISGYPNGRCPRLRLKRRRPRRKHW